EYIKIRTQAGDTQIIGLAWVNPATVQLVESVVVNVKIGNVAVADVPRIRNALVMNGFNSIEITVS
ncbi:MAG TPA: phage DNA polymerase-associated SH3 family protein, partial [Pyrinomonadaceae bacterium]|nr:phage DNA polymerase-associated SH3 family protein [Pyrinomonadaceae bacterium]